MGEGRSSSTGEKDIPRRRLVLGGELARRQKYVPPLARGAFETIETHGEAIRVWVLGRGTGTRVELVVVGTCLPGAIGAVVSVSAAGPRCLFAR